VHTTYLVQACVQVEKRCITIHNRIGVGLLLTEKRVTVTTYEYGRIVVYFENSFCSCVSNCGETATL